ncbi:UNVERIFIED_CONTAM: ribonuclease HI family protein, partial [Salmonella enterica subsp. enterica serovar Weltevreden]
GDRAGAGIHVVSPTKEEFAYALRFDFPATNNEVEYEALLSGMNLAFQLGARDVQIISDSQLIVNHVSGDYEAKEEPMKKYLQDVKNFM